MDISTRERWPATHEDETTKEALKMEPALNTSAPLNYKPFFKLSSLKKRHSESKLSTGPMKAFRQSLPASMRKRKPCSLVQRSETTINRSSTRAVARRDIPSSLLALHGTMKTELKRQVSKRLLQHKLSRLQDYSLPLPEEFTMGAQGEGAGSVKQSKKGLRKGSAADDDNDAVSVKQSKDPLVPEVSLSLKNVSVKSKSKVFPAEIDVDDADFLFGSSESLNVSTEVLSLKEMLQISAGEYSNKDCDLQQKIDREIKMREGTTKLLAASKHPNQLLEAARSLLTSNTRIISYMTELQRRKTQEVLGHSQLSEGNQLPCKAQISVSDIRIPLMWKDTDHFKNKGDYRQYAVFCLLKVGTEIFDTSMKTNVDRSMTDITFEDVILFRNIAHDFELHLEVYCHKLHEELSMANTPKKIRKKITDLSGSVGRSVGKRLSGLNDADVIGSMVLGPRFELVAKGTLDLQDVHDSVRTFDFQLEKNAEGKVHELPLFGNYCCRIAAVPGCLVDPAVSGFLNVQEDDDLHKWRRYWCVLKNLAIACWLTPEDMEVTQPLLSIPVTKSTQISDADPSTCSRAHTFLIKTVTVHGVSQHTLATDSKQELSKWWEGFQQHLLDQALWKHACDEVMTIKSPTKNKVPFYRKSSIYEDTPLIERDVVSDSLVSELKVDDAQLTHMLTTLMGEACQIRGSPSHGAPHS